jgi:hypothetical protein
MLCNETKVFTLSRFHVFFLRIRIRVSVPSPEYWIRIWEATLNYGSYVDNFSAIWNNMLSNMYRYRSKSLKLVKYWTFFWNFLDLILISKCLVIIIDLDLRIHNSDLRVLASFCSTSRLFQISYLFTVPVCPQISTRSDCWGGFFCVKSWFLRKERIFNIYRQIKINIG